MTGISLSYGNTDLFATCRRGANSHARTIILIGPSIVVFDSPPVLSPRQPTSLHPQDNLTSLTLVYVVGVRFKAMEVHSVAKANRGNIS